MSKSHFEWSNSMGCATRVRAWGATAGPRKTITLKQDIQADDFAGAGNVIDWREFSWW
jgi:hypothetical protein